jgi:hypothetical protein
MGFDKKHISKELILHNLKGEYIFGLVRDLKIDQIFKADALILDDWASKFYGEINKKEREIRKELGKYGMYSTHNHLLSDPSFKELISMSEALISLSNDPKWMDIYAVRHKLKFPVEKDEQGKFPILVKKSIDAILNYFDNKSN